MLLAVLLLEAMSEDDVHAVTREDQAGDAGVRADLDRHGAVAWDQHGGHEAAVAGLDDAARGNRFPGRDAAPDHRSEQIDRIGCLPDQIRLGDLGVGWPGLPAQMLFF